MAELENRREKLRAGIVGAGLMGTWHARAAARSGAEVVAVCDMNLTAADRLAKRFPGAKSWTDASQMMEESKIDALHVCTPLASHFALASAALTRGIHVIVEKPMAPTPGETERLYGLAAQHKALVCPVHQFLFQTGTREAHDRLPEIGRLLHMEAIFCSAGAEGAGGDGQDIVVGEILPHPLSLMDFFLPGCLEAGEWMVAAPAPGEFLATKIFDKTSLSILVSMNSRPTVCAMRLLGERGTIHLDFFHGFSFKENGRVSRTEKILHPFRFALGMLGKATANLASRMLSSEPAYPGLERLVRSFYESARDGTPPPIDAGQTVGVAKNRDLLLRHTGGPR